ncbi:hypothetical protein ACP70R_022999 [Stipagrostis hirtigluma subsp. patula]
MNGAQQERFRAMTLAIARSPARRPRRLNNLVHVTIEMIQEAIARSNGSYTLVINNTVLGTLKLCGKIETRCTDDEDLTSYTLSDDTGTIGGIMWPNDVTGKTAINDLQLRETVIVTGAMVKQDGRWQLNTYQAHRASDDNAMTLHTLQMVTEQLDIMRMPLPQDPQEKNLPAVHDGGAQAEESEEEPDEYDVHSKDKEDIMTILDDPNIKLNDKGASIEYVAYRLGKEETFIASLMDVLVKEGVAYATGPSGFYRSIGD